MNTARACLDKSNRTRQALTVVRFQDYLIPTVTKQGFPLRRAIQVLCRKH